MLRCVAILTFALSLAGCLGNRLEQGQIDLTYGSAAADLAPGIADRAQRAVRNIGEFWGEPYTRSVRINIDPSERRSNTRIHDGFINLDLKSALPASNTIEHEITHVVVGSDPARRRYLIEGIAMYCEFRFGRYNATTPTALTTYIDDWTRREIKKTGYMRLDRTDAVIADPALAYPAWRTVAYTEAASFVKFLLEIYGLEKFKRIYRGYDFEPVYGKNLEHLEVEWLEKVFPDIGGRKLIETMRASN